MYHLVIEVNINVSIRLRNKRVMSARRLGKLWVWARHFNQVGEISGLKIEDRTSLGVQWIRLCTSNTRDLGSIPGLRTTVPHASMAKKNRRQF